MDKKKLFTGFLESIEDQNPQLINAISQAFNTIYEATAPYSIREKKYGYRGTVDPSSQRYAFNNESHIVDAEDEFIEKDELETRDTDDRRYRRAGGFPGMRGFENEDDRRQLLNRIKEAYDNGDISDQAIESIFDSVREFKYLAYMFGLTTAQKIKLHYLYMDGVVSADVLLDKYGIVNPDSEHVWPNTEYMTDDMLAAASRATLP